MSGARNQPGTQEQATETAAELLAAGAILPPDTEGAGERAVPLTARAYRHPGLEDRVVVRLVPGELGVAEDAAAGFLGLEPTAEPAVVGLGLRQSLGFPEWVLVHYPQDGHHALGIVPELERAARQAKSKPKATLDAYMELAGRLAASVPHFLPTFFEQAGRVFVAVENPVYAAQMFTKARTAEAEHGLRIDEDRLDAVFLEFALAGALPVKVLAGYGRELIARLPAREALTRFTRLCVRRTAGGLPPSAQMTAELRKLAKAAGADADTVEQEYITELLGLPATMRAAVGWWKTHRAALVALARREPGIRRALLDATPAGDGEGEMAALWLDLLLASGAADALHDPAAPDDLRPADGTAGWLRRFQRVRESGGWWRNARRLPALYPLVELCAQRIRAELGRPAAAGGGGAPFAMPDDIDLLDLLLALGLPVADPGSHEMLNLERWSEQEDGRDLLALAADPRFRAAFSRGADRCGNDEKGLRTLRALIASPGGRPMLAGWVRAIARQFVAVGLPGLPNAVQRLAWLPGEVLALAEAEVRAAVATDLAPILARTLRTGLFDELTWPAWEQAAAQLVPRKDVDSLVVADAWPHLIVAGPTQVRVLGAEGAVLTHDLRIAEGDRHSYPGFHYVDGELLVYWNSRAAGGMRGYWHGSADRLLPIEARSTHGTRISWFHTMNTSLPLPQGGRAVGGGVLHRGDTAVPEDASVISDGTSYWVWGWDGADRNTAGWYEYDPESGRRGRMSTPAFFADTLRDAPVGTKFRSGMLRPAEDGLLGWCVIALPDGSLRGRDLAGREVTLARRSQEPVRAVVVPGDDRPRALVRGHYEVALVDADGVVTAEARTDRAPGAFARGTLILPPTAYWHFMRPRDPQGSAALRRIDDALAALLLKAGSEQRAAGSAEDALARIVSELIPQVADRALLAGISGVVAYAADQQATLDEVAARLEKALAGGDHRDLGPSGPDDSVVFEPLRSLGATRLYWSHGRDGDGVFRQIRLIGEALRETPALDGEIRIHLDGVALPHCAAAWWQPMLEGCSALAVRAASAATVAEVGEALRAVLQVCDSAGLAAPADQTTWRGVTVFLPDRLLKKPDGNQRSGSWQGMMPLPDGGLLAVIGSNWADGGVDFTALHHDPTGRFALPAPYALRATTAVGEQRETGWLGAFLAEWEKRGPAPWRPEAAEEFSRLTGVTLTEARLIIAGLPGLEMNGRNALPADRRAVLGAKTAEINVAHDQLRRVAPEALRAVIGALLPTDPARLWTQGPDADAAAQVWNTRVGQRTAVPEALLAEASRAIRAVWGPDQALPALLGPARSPELSRDLTWKVSGDRVAPTEADTPGFTAETLTGGVALAAWLAHRVPAGDPVRAALPAALGALRERLANPDLMLHLGRYAHLPQFRKTAGAPTEVADGYERYGAVIMSTHDNQPMPAVRVAHLDASGADPYLAVLRGDAQTPFPLEVALGLVRDPAFADLLADPGEPAAGERAKDGTWSPQDPARSVPDLVAHVVAEYGLGADAAALYLMLLAMPDPTDRATARWTGWKPARMKAARAELAATDLVVTATRPRAGRTLFLPGAWAALRSPHMPLEEWKTTLYGGLLVATIPVLGVIVPVEPVARLYRRSWQRVREGDGPRFTQLKVGRARARRR